MEELECPLAVGGFCLALEVLREHVVGLFGHDLGQHPRCASGEFVGVEVAGELDQQRLGLRLLGSVELRPEPVQHAHDGACLPGGQPAGQRGLAYQGVLAEAACLPESARRLAPGEGLAHAQPGRHGRTRGDLGGLRLIGLGRQNRGERLDATPHPAGDPDPGEPVGRADRRAVRFQAVEQ